MLVPGGCDSIQDRWHHANEAIPPTRRSSFNSLAVLCMYNIWLERNKKVFDSIASPRHILLGKIRQVYPSTLQFKGLTMQYDNNICYKIIPNHSKRVKLLLYFSCSYLHVNELKPGTNLANQNQEYRTIMLVIHRIPSILYTCITEKPSKLKSILSIYS